MEDNKNWVIVMTAAGNFIGKKVDKGDMELVNSKGIPAEYELNPAFTWVNDQVMVGPGQMAMMRQAVPLQGNLEANKLTIYKWVAVQNLDEWPDHSKNEVLRQVNHVIDGLKADSAKKVRIIAP